MVKALTITSPREGFRRCGRKFGREPVTIPRDELTDEEAERLTDDPYLVVVEVDLGAAPPAEKPPATRGTGAKA